MSGESDRFAIDPSIGDSLVERVGDRSIGDLRGAAESLLRGAGVDSVRPLRMNHAQLISAVTYLTFVVSDFDALRRPPGFDYPKSLLCFAGAWWEDEHLGVFVTVTPEERQQARRSSAWPLDANELFPRRGVPPSSFGDALQKMFGSIVDAANALLEPSGGQSLNRPHA